VSDSFNTISIDAGDIEYHWTYPTSGQASDDRSAIVLLHEGLGCVAMWRDFPQNLADACDRNVFSYSRFGYGGSSPCELPRPGSYMHDDALDHLGPILDAAGIQSVILVGHSDGASIAAIYAGGKNDPRVKGIVLMAPHFFCEDVSVASIAAARKAWDEGNLREKLARYHGENVDCAFLGWNDTWQQPEMLEWNLVPYLECIEVPVLAIQGKDDAYGTDDQVNVISEYCYAPKTVHLLDDCGHSPYQDQSETTLALITEFSNQLK